MEEERDHLIERLQSGRLTRREFVRRTAVFGVTASALSGLVAACGRTSKAPGATATTSTSAPKPTSAPTKAPATGTKAPSPTSAATSPVSPTSTTVAPSATGTMMPSATSTSGPSAQVGTFKSPPCPKKGGTAVIGFVQEPDILDPFVTGMTFTVWLLHTLDVPMIRAVKGGKLQPMLLTEVPTTQNGGISKDGLTYTIHFKPNLKWSDGQPITARDLVFTWKTVMNPDYGAGSQLGWDHIKDIKLSDNDLTATITLKAPYVPFFAYVLAGTGDTTGGMLLPEHFFKGMKPADYTKSKYGSAGSNGHVGSGPFKIVSWQKGTSITVERNPNYSGKAPCLDRMVFSVLASSDQQTSQLQTGDIDMGTNYTEADTPTLKGLRNVSIIALSDIAGGIERFMYNLNDPNDPETRINPKKAKPHPLFKDKNVRLAIAYACNRFAYAAKVLHGGATVAVTELDRTKWFNHNLKPYPYDPKKAAQLLDASGWKMGSGGVREKNGVKLSFNESTTSGNPVRETIQRAMITDLQKVGIQMNIKNYPPSKLFATYSQGGIVSVRAFDMASYTTSINPLDPDLTPFYATSQIPSKTNGGVGGNIMGYSNPTVDKLLNEQVAELDSAKRTAELQQIQKMVYDDIPLVYWYDRKAINAIGPKLKGFIPDTVAGIWWDPEDWYLT